MDLACKILLVIQKTGRVGHSPAKRMQTGRTAKCPPVTRRSAYGCRAAAARCSTGTVQRGRPRHSGRATVPKPFRMRNPNPSWHSIEARISARRRMALTNLASAGWHVFLPTRQIHGRRRAPGFVEKEKLIEAEMQNGGDDWARWSVGEFPEQPI